MLSELSGIFFTGEYRHAEVLTVGWKHRKWFAINGHNTQVFPRSDMAILNRSVLNTNIKVECNGVKIIFIYDQNFTFWDSHIPESRSMLSVRKYGCALLSVAKIKIYWRRIHNEISIFHFTSWMSQPKICMNIICWTCADVRDDSLQSYKQLIFSEKSLVGYYGDIQPRTQGFLSNISTSLGVMSRPFGEQRSGNGSEQGDNARSEAPSGNPCLLVGNDGGCIGSVCRTSSLNEIIAGSAMLFFGLCAGVGFAFSQPDGKRTNLGWLATGTARAVVCGFFAIAAVAGKVWLFWL